MYTRIIFPVTVLMSLQALSMDGQLSIEHKQGSGMTIARYTQQYKDVIIITQITRRAWDNDLVFFMSKKKNGGIAGIFTNKKDGDKQVIELLERELHKYR